MPVSVGDQGGQHRQGNFLRRCSADVNADSDPDGIDLCPGDAVFQQGLLYFFAFTPAGDKTDIGRGRVNGRR